MSKSYRPLAMTYREAIEELNRITILLDLFDLHDNAHQKMCKFHALVPVTNYSEYDEQDLSMSL